MNYLPPSAYVDCNAIIKDLSIRFKCSEADIKSVVEQQFRLLKATTLAQVTEPEKLFILTLPYLGRFKCMVNRLLRYRERQLKYQLNTKSNARKENIQTK